MELLNTLINKITGWVDNLFSIFGFYSEKYSVLLVYGLLAVIFAKIFQVRLKVTK